jgi:RNA polymerase I-specific transcription initiation factor RRN6
MPLSAIAWKSEIEGLNSIHPRIAVYSFNIKGPHLCFSMPTSLSETCSQLLKIAYSSLCHQDSNRINREQIVAISEQIAYDLYLSFYGVGYRNLSANEPQASVEEHIRSTSQSENITSSPPTPISYRSSSETVEKEDAAMALLRSYTGSGKFVPERNFELLDKWKLGAEPSDYIFDLDRSGDAEARMARIVKRVARENRKRRRTQSILNLSQEPELPATQPAPETGFFSSQPRVMSSQRQIILSDPVQPMSQPSRGLFGRRPNKKVKVKKEGGFR